MRGRIQSIVSIAGLALGGCSLFLSTSDLSGEGASSSGGQTQNGEGGPDTGNGSSSSSSGGVGGEAGATDSGVGTPGVLHFVKNADNWKTRVDGFFELTFADSSFKHPTEWRDLATSTTNYADKPLYQPPTVRLSAGWIEDSATPPANEWGVVDIFDATPVFVSFASYSHNPQVGGADVKRWSRFTVHATGRVAVETWITNAGTSSFSALEIAYHNLYLSQTAAWDIVPHEANSAVSFFLKGGTTSLTIVNQAGDTMISGNPSNRHWDKGGRTFAPSEELRVLGEIQLGVTRADAFARRDDVRNPELEILSGGDANASSYIQSSGCYYIKATTGNLTFALGPSRTRFTPTFVIENVPAASTTWKLSVGGTIIASAQNPVTSLGVAKYDEANAGLTVAYFGTVAANIPTAQRTFLLER